jgi:hypothetical protein
MANEAKPRTAPLSPLPADREFTPRGENDSAGRERDRKQVEQTHLAEEDILSASNPQKVAFFEALAQETANRLNCAVLLHYRQVPHYQWTTPTMRAELIPAYEGATLERPEWVPPALW